MDIRIKRFYYYTIRKQKMIGVFRPYHPVSCSIRHIFEKIPYPLIGSFANA